MRLSKQTTDSDLSKASQRQHGTENASEWGTFSNENQQVTQGKELRHGQKLYEFKKCSKFVFDTVKKHSVQP